jgi:hypothetical protein
VDTTTIGEIYMHLMSLGVVPTAGPLHLYFTHAGHRVSWSDTMQSLGMGPLSHLQMRIVIPGGADPGVLTSI